MSTTLCQYCATSLSPKLSQRYTRFRMSFWKQLPPKPTELLRKWGPTRGSVPTARATSSTSAPDTSHRAEMELIDEMRWARKALATSLDSSEDHRLVVMMRSRSTQYSYTSTSFWMAASPSGVCWPPMRTRLGLARSAMAVPSARNSGLLRIWCLMPLSLQARTRPIDSAVRTGTVDFSTTILGEVAILAMVRAQFSQFLMLAARPAPIPDTLVGVLTETKMMSPFSISPSTSVEKKRFLPRQALTTSSRPGS
mmetsp:Transcript_2063/g.5298  ORF Transcript_2063/g.5298 Transcript_2063/m.5298 type:complete len:253 (+) Transcript_2063:516-1274(+)